MPYKGTENFSHKQSERLGVLVTNLGTPDAPTTPALRRYLGEFLWDPRVVEFPAPSGGWSCMALFCASARKC